jgi:hypothetical protein
LILKDVPKLIGELDVMLVCNETNLENIAMVTGKKTA